MSIFSSSSRIGFTLLLHLKMRNLLLLLKRSLQQEM